jgi:hypothetical protein
MPDAPVLVCTRPTGPYLAEPQSSGPHRQHWTGPDGEPKVPCGYEAKDMDGLLCHLLATHEMTLEQARRSVGPKPN